MVQNPDGRRWVARVNVATLRDEDGSVVGAINCFKTSRMSTRCGLKSERQQRTLELAMIASKMSTWRYTLADNVCVYDEDAQRLYGLTEVRFLHDKDGAEAKFHPTIGIGCGPVWLRRSIPKVTVATTSSTG